MIVLTIISDQQRQTASKSERLKRRHQQGIHCRATALYRVDYSQAFAAYFVQASVKKTKPAASTSNSERDEDSADAHTEPTCELLCAKGNTRARPPTNMEH